MNLKCILNGVLWWIIIVQVILQVESLPSFRLGRHWNGFVGDPSKIDITPDPYTFEEQWFKQKLDHFPRSNKDLRTWNQRYFINDKFYTTNNYNRKTSPIFLMISGEAEASSKWINQGAWIHYAKVFDALCFLLEHRFYGQSHPTSDLSVRNLKYLTSQQALADVALFIQAMNFKYNLDPSQKWIVFGGSYAGNLAAWAREKYPSFVFGAISSSGPLLAQIDFTEYYDIVQRSLASYNESCVEAVKQSFSQIDILLRHMIGQQDIDKKFRTCTPISESVEYTKDITNFFESIASNFANIVQYNKDNNQRATLSIDEACDMMLDTSIGPQYNRLAMINSILLNDTKKDCLDYSYDAMIMDLKNTSWTSEAASGMRQWIWQTCNEFGYYQTSEKNTSLFGERFGIDFFTQQCREIYGRKMNIVHLHDAVNETNKFYGGLRPATTNVLYVHGSIDPWHVLGLTKTRDQARPAIFIEGTAHCADMYEPTIEDSPELIKARNSITKYLSQLLDHYRNINVKQLEN